MTLPVEAPVVVAGEDAAAPDGRGGLLWWATAGVIVADQAAKALVQARIALYDSSPIVAGIVDLVHVRNTGVAFGVLNESRVPFKTAATITMALLALGGIGLYARQLRSRERIARLGLSLILGGAAGNLVDRLRVGYVVDFVDVHWRNWHFWAFNVADSAITIGAILVFVDLLLVTRHASRTV
jgi:signal peptidase II